MRKAKKAPAGTMIKSLAWLALIMALAAGGYWAYMNVPEVTTMTAELLQQEHPTLTFEVVYSPDMILQKHQKELLRDPTHAPGDSYVIFVPHLLMEVKYLRDDKKTEEAKLLWNMHSGEMVLDTATFENTRGFEECIRVHASEEDFRILHAILRHGGSVSRETLLQDIGGNFEQLTTRLENLKKKHLISLRQELVRIHLQNPILQVKPYTNIRHALVVQSSSDKKIKARYSKEQVHKIAQAAFGQDFAIQSDQCVYVPYVVIEVKNPDNSILKTYWNGVTGKNIIDYHL
jgi:hypothetical protein